MGRQKTINYEKRKKIIIAAAGLIALKMMKNGKNKRLPSVRVNPYLRERNMKGRFFRDYEDLKKHTIAFNENFHMNVNTFENIFQRIEEHLICKNHTRKDEIPPKAKFAAVIEYLASGSLQRHIASLYRISKQHFGSTIDLVCGAICNELKHDIPPMNTENLKNIAAEFSSKWNFPNCVGAIDGKHVAIRAPSNSGTLFHNYKGFFSIVLLAMCDANYRFTYLDIGAFGSEGDANIFLSSELGKKIISDELDFPPDEEIDNERIPYYFIGDGAFPLGKRMMKPFGKNSCTSHDHHIFNYRLSRARRCIENTFGILSTKWACLKKVMYCNPERAQKIITACCLLHNYLMNANKSAYCPPKYADGCNKTGELSLGDWRKHVQPNSIMGSSLQITRGRYSDEGKNIREKLMKYFCTTGAVPWQRII